MGIEDELLVVAHLPASYQLILTKMYAVIGLPIDQLNLICLLVISALLALIYRNISNTIVRHLFSTVSGLTLMYSLYDLPATLLLVAYVVVMYPIVQLKNARISFWITQCVLVSAFMYTAYYYYLLWRIDFTTSLMGITIRLHTLTWDLVDGEKLKKKQPLGKYKNAIKFRTEHACQQLTFFEYISFMLFFVHVLAGSNMTIMEYLQLSDRTLFQKNGWRDRRRDPTPNFRRMLRATAGVVSAACIYLFGLRYLPFPNYLLTTEFLNRPMWLKFCIIPVVSFLNKFKYHFSFKFLDLTALLSGAAFTSVEYDSKGNANITWNRARNINSFPSAFPNSTVDIVRNWNMSANVWLTNYVFARVEPSRAMQAVFGNKGSKIMITRVTSALWHGVYPGCYVFFVGSAIASTAIDGMRMVLPTKDDFKPHTLSRYFWFVFWATVTNLCLDTIGVSFMMQDIKDTVRLYRNLYWSPFLIVAAYVIIAKLLILTIGLKQSVKDKNAKRKAQKSKKLK